MSGVFAFERDPYLRELQVEILEVGREGERYFGLLDDSVLYPEGGGQPSDRGWLSDVPVIGVRKVGDKLRHEVEEPLAAGPASLVLDWSRRFDHMQQHTAQHLLTAIALKGFGWATRSFHIGPDVCDIELDREPLAVTEMEAWEEQVAEVVGAARSVRSFRVSRREYERLEVRSRGLPADHAGDIRLVEVEGVDLNTCGGTHVRSTAEVGAVKILRSEPLRGGCRVYWVAGRRVRRRLEAHESRNADLRGLLDTADDQLVSVVQLKLEQLARAGRSQRQLEDRLAAARTEGLLAEAGEVVDAHFDGVEVSLLRPVAEQLAERGDLRAALLTASGEGGDLFAVVSGPAGGFDLRSVGEAVAKVLGGRGGGAGRVFQGKAGSLAHRSQALGLLRRLLSKDG